MEDEFTPLPVEGEVYEGFVLEKLLGAGSFAAVYRARSPDYPGPVAIKLSRTPVFEESTALRALREIGVMSSLTNRHVVRIFDHGMGADERWYIVMEFLQGVELGSAHDFRQPMPPVLALELIRQACMGLDEAHKNGIVHRDIKPDNLWITREDEVKVLDFGLARAWDADTTIAATATIGHMLIGTPHYAQPEQIQTGKLTPASDVYSLGVILYELLTGRTPLFPDLSVPEAVERMSDTPLKWLLAHVQEPVVPITRYPEGQSLPADLVELIDKALAKDPGDRPPSAGVMANRLGWILHHHYGEALAAILEITTPSGAKRQQPLLPGSHRIGFSPRCEIRLASDESLRLHAILEWSGGAREAEVRPLRNDGSLRLNGETVRGRVPVSGGDELRVGRFALRITYPATSSS